MDAPLTIAVHSGVFHVDDIFAAATVSLWAEAQGRTWTVVRSRDPEVLGRADVVLDVGGIYDSSIGRFDHHQKEGAGERDGIPYSSLGLAWKHYGMDLCAGDDAVWKEIEMRVVRPVDMGDNGKETYTPIRSDIHPYLVHGAFAVFRPTWKEGKVHDERFHELLSFARRVLERELVTARDYRSGAAFTERIYQGSEDKRLIVLDAPYPWQEILGGHPEPLFVVKPKSSGDGWEAEAVRDDYRSFASRCYHPESWRGLLGEDLARITGVSDALFCHRSGYVAVARSKEGALALAQKSLAALASLS